MEASTELEEQLREAGNKLLKPPPAVEELLPLLDEAVTFLTKVEQSPAKSVHDALSPLVKALVEDVLLKHSNVDVKVALASCLSEITRITAPDAPYDDDKMKAIFELIVSSFENLYDESSRSFNKRVMIIETVCKVRLCVVMLDLECDELISRMFQYFLKAIREYHPDHIFSSMESIMIIVLEESEEISMDLVTNLLASVKKENKDIKPTGKRLAESVITKCAVRLKPYFKHAVKSQSLSLDEYSNVVTSVMQGTPIAVECNNDTSKDPLMAEDAQQGECSKDDNQAADTSPKSAVGNDVIEGIITDSQSLTKLGTPERADISNLTPRSTPDDSQAESTVKPELEVSEQTTKDKGRKSSSQSNVEDSMDQDPLVCQISNRDGHSSLAENSAEEQKGSGEVITNSPIADTTVEAAKLLEENESSAQVFPHKTSKDEADNVPSSDPSLSVPNEIQKETIQPKEDDNLVQEESQCPELGSKNPSEGRSDSELQPKDLSTKVQKKISLKEETDSMRDAEATGLKQQVVKAKANDKKFVSSKKKDKHTIQPKEDDTSEIVSKKPSDGSDSESQPIDYGTRVQTEAKIGTSHGKESGSMSDAEVKSLKQKGEKAKANKKVIFSSKKKHKHTTQPKKDDVHEESVFAETSSKKPFEKTNDSDSNSHDLDTRVPKEADSMSDRVVKGLKKRGGKAKANKKKVVSSKKKGKRSVRPKDDDSLVQKKDKAPMPAEITSKKPLEETSDSESHDPDTRVHTETSHEEESGSMSDAEMKCLKERKEKPKSNKRNGIFSKKRVIQAKEDSSLVQEESVDAETASKTPHSEDTSDSESLPQNPSTRAQKESSHEDEADSISDTGVEDLKQQGVKTKAIKRKGGSSKKNDKPKRRQRGKASIEIDVSKSSTKDDRLMFSEESRIKCVEDDAKEGSKKKNTKRKRSLGKEKGLGNPEITYDESLVGSSVQVFWPLDDKYYDGVISSFDHVKNMHTVLYTDGEVETLNLMNEKWHIVSETLTEKKDLDAPSSPDVSAEMQRQKKKKSRELVETSSKHDVSPKSAVPKSRGPRTKSSGKSKVSANVEAKSKGRPSKSTGSNKSKDMADNRQSYDSDDEGSGKLKDIIGSSPRSKSVKPDPSTKTATTKVQQDTPTTKAAPKSEGKANSGTGKSKPISKGKDTADGGAKRKATEVTVKPPSKEEIETKSGKKGVSSKEEEIGSKSGKKRRRK
ncbi:unnamed protein product [Cuscuta campestris]|uniref:Tudor domain-containing protein n=1 Tax=Cuscuta campestris TaxID=132261 RepID=A0A484M7Q7_9ASTE|nr:unnamed protein product [Cuscuta campestris]